MKILTSDVGHLRTNGIALPVVCTWGEADETGAKADIQTTPDSHACYSVSASLWLGGLRPRYA